MFSHMLQHVVNHATYHRGQVTTMLRQLGAPAPKPQDLIRFYRDRASEFTERSFDAEAPRRRETLVQRSMAQTQTSLRLRFAVT